MAVTDHLLAKDWYYIDKLLLQLDPAGTGDVVINLISSSDKTLFFEECQLGNLLQFTRNYANLLADRGIKWGMTWILIMNKRITMPSGRKIYSNLYSTLLPDAAAQTWIPISNVEWGETWNYDSADAPSFVIVVGIDVTQKYSPGMRIKLTQGTTTKYFIITKVELATGQTLVTVYGGTDYVLVDEPILHLYYSAAKAPHGFPLDPAKWTVEVTNNTDTFQSSPVLGVWYNLGSINISIPIGCWIVKYFILAYTNVASTASLGMFATLSTVNNNESDKTFTAIVGISNALSNHISLDKENPLLVSSKTTYYLNAKTSVSNVVKIQFTGSIITTVIRAVCAYL